VSEIELLRFAIGSAALVFAAEDWTLRAQLAPTGPRAWATQRREYDAGPARRLGDAFFGERGLTLNLALRVAAALGLLISPQAIDAVVLIFATWIWSVRWRGTFNGGSDQMTLIVLIGLCAYLVDARAERIALAYVGAHLIVAFVIAGLAKLRNSEWRNGRALRTFAADAGVTLSARRACALSWATMGFELSVPFSLVHPRAALAVAAAGMAFHAVNAYLFGLNRFLLTWAAAYPALYALAAT